MIRRVKNAGVSYTKSGGRINSWKQDTSVVPGDKQATSTMYKGSGYSKGHLAPYQAFNWDPQLTNIYTNAAPQNQKSNTNWYNYCERITISKAYKTPGETFRVETFTSGALAKKMKGTITIPMYWVKCICQKSTGQSLCFWIQNDENGEVYTLSAKDARTSFQDTVKYNLWPDLPICNKSANEATITLTI